MSQGLRHLHFWSNGVHPTLILFLWLFAVVLIQRLPLPWLVLSLLVSVVASNSSARSHWRQLLKRSRWLLLVLALTFFLLTPGEILVSGLPVTEEGVLLAMDHLVRLVTVLFAVAWLVGGRTLESLQAGLWGAADLLRSGSMKRAVARLSMTLKYSVESRSQPVNRKNWKVLLEDLSIQDDLAPIDHFEFSASPIPFAQVLLVIAAGVGTGLVWWGLA